MHRLWDTGNKLKCFLLGSATVVGICVGVALRMRRSTTKLSAHKPYIVATTGMIGDAIQHIVGDTAEVIVLMGPGVDPHTYSATLQDVDELHGACAVFYNGLELEGKKMEQAFQQWQTKQPHVYALSQYLPPEALIRDPEFENGIDPHVWFDIPLWVKAIAAMGQALARVCPAHAALYAQRTQDYITQLLQLHQDLIAQAHTIPASQRILVTTHDAFAYFARSYGFEVKSLQGISTAAEYGLQDMTELIAFVTQHRVPAVFVEPSLSPKSLQAVQAGCAKQGHTVKLSLPLYADALGPKDSSGATYVGMMQANMTTITRALSSTQ